MGGFKFHLESVETLRKSSEQSAQLALAQTQRALQAELNRKISLENQLSLALTQRESLGSTPSITQDFAIQELFIQGLKQQIIQADSAIYRAKKFVDRAMAEVLERRKQRRMIEKLREKAYERFLDEKQRKENREMDDLAVMRARFKKEVA